MRAVGTDGRDSLSDTLQELVTDLAVSRRTCRELQSEIDVLMGEIARLSTPTSSPGTQPDADQFAVGRLNGPQGRRAQHEHTIAQLSTVVLVLRRGNLALKQENTSLRLELQQLHAVGNTRPA